MKKIVCIMACLITYNLCADSLLDAIRKRDVQTVERLLESNDFSPNYYEIYITAIEESIGIAREQMFIQRWRPASDDTYSSLYLASVLASAGGIAWAAAHDQNNWAIFFMTLPFIALPLACKGFEKANQHVQQQYKDAVQIQDLIFTTFADLT